MIALTTLHDCLELGLGEVVPLAVEHVAVPSTLGCVLAEAVSFPVDQPSGHEALRAGYAVSALDLVGASSDAPLPLPAEHPVVGGEALPVGTDAVLPAEGVEPGAFGLDAIRPVHPGEGVRRAGHDARAGERFADAGTRVTATQLLLAELCGLTTLPVRQARVQVALVDRRQQAFVTAWLHASCAATCVETAVEADLIIRTTTDPTPRLALAPAETAWLDRDARNGRLTLQVPPRHDGLVTALLALGVPTLAALLGSEPRQARRPLTGKVGSTIGWSELLLVHAIDTGWSPAIAGHVTLRSLVAAQAFAVLPPESEGCAAGTALAATPILQPFGE